MQNSLARSLAPLSLSLSPCVGLHVLTLAHVSVLQPLLLERDFRSALMFICLLTSFHTNESSDWALLVAEPVAFGLARVRDE